MNTSSIRPLIAPVAIGLSIIVGAKLYLVQPMKDRLEQTRLQTQSPVADIAQLSRTDLSLDELSSMQAEADRRYQNILLAGQIVRNEGMLFQSISDISLAANVSLERLDPQTRVANTSLDLSTESLRCSIEAIGSYGAIAVFVHDLERDLGITFVRSLHIAPVQGHSQSLVLASIETEHFSIMHQPSPTNGGQD